MSAERNARWYLERDTEGFVRGAEGELDMIEIEIAALQRVKWEETRARLQRLGFDTSKFRPPVPLHPSEQFCTRWPSNQQVVEYQYERAARGPKGERQRRRSVTVDEATGRVTEEFVEPVRRYFATEITVR